MAGLALGADAALRGPGPVHAALLGGTLLAIGIGAVLLTWPPFRDLGRGGRAAYLRRLAALPVLLAALVVLNAVAVLAALRAGRRDFVRTPKRGESA